MRLGKNDRTWLQSHVRRTFERGTPLYTLHAWRFDHRTPQHKLSNTTSYTSRWMSCRSCRKHRVIIKAAKLSLQKLISLQVRDEARATNDPARGGMGGLALAEMAYGPLQGVDDWNRGRGDWHGGGGGGGNSYKRPRVDWDARNSRR